MNCPVHVGTAMILVSAKRPFFAFVTLNKWFIKDKRKKERLIWRCPVEGCPYVAGAEDTASLEGWERRKLEGLGGSTSERYAG